MGGGAFSPFLGCFETELHAAQTVLTLTMPLRMALSTILLLLPPESPCPVFNVCFLLPWHCWKPLNSCNMISCFTYFLLVHWRWLALSGMPQRWRSLSVCSVGGCMIHFVLLLLIVLLITQLRELLRGSPLWNYCFPFVIRSHLVGRT